jgi:hypothetical protein
VRAKLLALSGTREHAEALAFAREAVRLAETTDALNLHAKVVLDLAEVLRLGGSDRESAGCIAEAVVLYERKGNAVSAEAARARLAHLATA